jgi:uncharacterized protein
MRAGKVERLTREQCVKHMERHPIQVGRVALAGPRPVIFPVNYAIDGDSILFRTDAGTKFHAALQKEFAAFEVDWAEPTWQLGWSVVVRGQAYLVTERVEIQRLQELPLWPWAEGDKSSFVRIPMELVSGRNLQE